MGAVINGVDMDVSLYIYIILNYTAKVLYVP
jgi:hypothetical protein